MTYGTSGCDTFNTLLKYQSFQAALIAIACPAFYSMVPSYHTSGHIRHYCHRKRIRRHVCHGLSTRDQKGYMYTRFVASLFQHTIPSAGNGPCFCFGYHEVLGLHSFFVRLMKIYYHAYNRWEFRVSLDGNVGIAKGLA